MQKSPLKIVFVSWALPVPRSKNIARALGAKNYYIQYMKGTYLIFQPIRFFLQAIKTWTILLQERPDVVIAMNPPILLPLTIYLYSRIIKSRFIIDSHTGVFLGIWRRFLFVHRYLSRRAITTIVTNTYLESTILSWGARAFVLEIEIPELPIAVPFPKFTRPSVCVINSFADDEPLHEILVAAKNMPAYDFYITGKVPSRGKKHALLREKPVNVNFTGFLPDLQYIELLNRVDVIMVLVKRNLTLLQGASEAVAVEKPLITSDWPVLKDYYNKGVLYVDNSPNAIENAVDEAFETKVELRNDIKALKRRLRIKWYRKIDALLSYIYNFA